MSVRIAICFLLLGFLITPIQAATYYVRNGGNDDADGLSHQSAWATINKVNSTSFAPGDSILFERGSTWRDMLRIDSSGSAGAWITFGNYGSGSLPRLLGSEKAENWVTTSTPNVWRSQTPLIDPDAGLSHYGSRPGNIFFVAQNGAVTWGHHENYTASLSNLQNEYDWTWNNKSIYVYSPSDPSSRYREIEAAQRQQSIYMPDNDPQAYIVIDGLEMMYTFSKGFMGGYPASFVQHLQIKNCHIGYIGVKDGASAYGIAAWHSNMLIEDNEIHDCGRRGLSIAIYDHAPTTMRDVTVQGNHFYNGFHTTGVDCSNNGAHTIENVIIRNNRFEGDLTYDLSAEDAFNSNSIFLANVGSGYTGGFQIYNNVFRHSHASSIKFAGLDNVSIQYNTFYDFNLTIENWQAHVYMSSNPTNVSVTHNIFHNNAEDNRLACIKLDQGDQNQVEIDYNLYYHTNPSTRVYWVNGGTSYRFNDWNNYKSATGYDSHSPSPADPQFSSAPEDLTLRSTSPARNAGGSMSPIATDFRGYPRTIPPDLGAYEFGGNISPMPPQALQIVN